VVEAQPITAADFNAWLAHMGQAPTYAAALQAPNVGPALWAHLGHAAAKPARRPRSQCQAAIQASAQSAKSAAIEQATAQLQPVEDALSEVQAAAAFANIASKPIGAAGAPSPQNRGG
jgi:hypothetical protein